MLFDVTIGERGAWSVARVVGDVDLATMPALRSALDRTDPSAVVLDLSEVGLVDPLALGVLLSARLRSTRRRGRFVVCCPAGAVRDLFEELGLDTTFELVDHIDLLDDTDDLDVLDDTALLDDTDDRPR